MYGRSGCVDCRSYNSPPMRPLIVFAVILSLLACAKAKPAKPLSEPGEKVYALKGKIVARDAGENSLRVDHEAIAGFMEAMTMDYPVRGASVKELPPDQTKVEAKLHVHDEHYWLTDVKKVP